MNKKGLLIILDGYGEGKPNKYNAVENANTPFLKRIKQKYPFCLLKTDSKFVGLPNNTMGGSEVGHMTIGAGKIKRSMQLKVDEQIETGEFFKNEILIKKLKELKQSKGALHLGGLWSDKQIHSNINHCFALMKIAKQLGIKRVFVHAFTDGRDTAPQSCSTFFEMFKEKQSELGVGEIATIGGRFYAMDRENNLDRVEMALSKMQNKVYDFYSVEEVIKENYNKNLYDEFFIPARIKTEQDYDFTNNDLMIFFNTRADRMKQIVNMLKDKKICNLLTFCNFVDGVDFLFDEDKIENTLSEYLSKNNLKQVKISESTKYAHVTYFLNGGREKPFAGEDRIHVETEKTDDFSKTPYMKAKDISKHTLKCIDKGYDAVIVNFSNPDMIGHTGNYTAVVKALEFLDKCVEKIVKKALKNQYFIMVTADHGNAEEMIDDNGNIQTAHSLNPVRCVVIDADNKNIKLKDGGLANVAPTFVKLLGLKPNPSFDHKSLF